MSSKPTIYISKKCKYCIELIKVLRNRPDIRGNFSIISIDENPFPNYVKAVPCMVSGDEMYNATEIFGMLEESNDGSTENSNGPPSQKGECSVASDGGEPQCDINGYCSDGSCLAFSSLEGENSNKLDTYYSTIEETKTDQNISHGGKDEYKNSKKDSFDSEYERMMSERGDLNGGGQQPVMNFAR